MLVVSKLMHLFLYQSTVYKLHHFKNFIFKTQIKACHFFPPKSPLAPISLRGKATSSFQRQNPTSLFSTKSDIIHYLFIIHSNPGHRPPFCLQTWQTCSHVMALISLLWIALLQVKSYINKSSLTSDLLIKLTIPGYSLKKNNIYFY